VIQWLLNEDLAGYTIAISLIWKFSKKQKGTFGNSRIISGGQTGAIFLNFFEDLGGSGSSGGISGFQSL